MSKTLNKRLEEIEQVMLVHTPGNWVVNATNPYPEVTNGTRRIAVSEGNTTEAVANTHLMAASKDMFAALKRVIRYNLDGQERTFDKEAEQILNECIDAIKKAEGNG